MAINKQRVLAIGGVALFTTLAGLLTTEAIFDVNISLINLCIGSLIVAVIQAGLAICQEVKSETETKECLDNHNCQSKGMKRNALLLF